MIQPNLGSAWGGTRPHRWNAESFEDWAVIACLFDDIRSSKPTPMPNVKEGLSFELNEVSEIQHRPSIRLEMDGRSELKDRHPSFPVHSHNGGRGHRLLICKGKISHIGPRTLAGADLGHFFSAQDNDWLS